MKNKFVYLFLFLFFALVITGCSKTTSEVVTTVEQTTIEITTSTEVNTTSTTSQPIITTTSSLITTEPITETPTTEPIYYTVTFMQDDIILKQEIVAEGASATPPENTDKPSSLEFHYTFDGWDKAYTYIYSDLVINAIYIETPVLYNVTFYDYDGESIIDDI